MRTGISAAGGSTVATTVRVGGGLCGSDVVAAPPDLMMNMVAATIPSSPMTVAATRGQPASVPAWSLTDQG